MFKITAVKPTPQKRAIYLIAATFMGIELSFIVHSVVEYLYLQAMSNADKTVHWYTVFSVAACSLHPLVQYAIFVIGTAGGYLLGRMWWQLVYIDRAWAKHQIKIK